jgi:hypothetical protein
VSGQGWLLIVVVASDFGPLETLKVLANALRPTTDYFLEGSQTLTFCSACKRTILMQVNVERWWDDTGKGNLDLTFWHRDFTFNSNKSPT